MSTGIQPGDSKLWNQFFVAANLPCTVEEIQEVLEVRSGSYDNDDMSFEGKFRLKDGRIANLSGSYAPTYGCVNNATGTLS